MSKILFQKIRFKNLLSYGNAFTEFDYTTHKHTIVTAKNGSGKSGFGLDALCYALFNKPYRDIKLGQLVNSINNKQLVVEIEFEKGTEKYKVVRGQKPSVFEIWKNGELIPEDSNSLGYQETLETILGFNYKTFKQIVVIGSAGYVQFMNLKAPERRAIIEDILSISVFSDMQEIAKKEVTTLKSAISAIDYEIDLCKSQMENQKKMIAAAEFDLEQAEKERLEKLQTQLDKLETLKEDLNSIDVKIESLKEKTKDQQKFTKQKKQLYDARSKLTNEVSAFKKTLDFFSHNETCPTCTQEIDLGLKQSVVSDAESNIAVRTGRIKEFDDYYEGLETKLSAIEAIMDEVWQLESKRRVVDANITNANDLIRSLSVPAKAFVGSVEESKRQLNESLASVVEKNDAKAVLQEKLDYHSMAVNMLKDTGIKARIISSFIPIMNQYINEYLNLFDMFVNFELNETFDETIKSRHRDAFTYNSFSEGEKMRIDMSILFAWRKIAMMKNSISTNLIIFDETLDRSLDAESVDTFMELLDNLDPDVHTIVISHRGVAPEMFDRHVEIKKVNDMSILQCT